jgi:hypothetical protein
VIRGLILGLAAPLLAQQIPLERLKPLFDYDASRPLEARTQFLREEPGAKISEVTYASPMGGRVDAFLVEPAAQSRRRPGIVFGHWGPGNRSEFVPEAIVYAKAGAVSLLINYAARLVFSRLVPMWIRLASPVLATATGRHGARSFLPWISE